MHAIKSIFISLIKVYQLVSRTTLSPACRFHPSCSQYTLEAIQKYGVGKGCVKAIKRIAKCSPFFHGGYDPLV